MTYKSSLLVLASGILFISAFWSNNNNAIIAYGQQQMAPTFATTLSVKITLPTKSQQVPSGELTITGISSDDATSDCAVYTDWNDLKPMQKVSAIGSGGADDYSSWSFTYSKDYHLITEGENEITSKISCENSPSNITKSYSINVTGVAKEQDQQKQQQQQQQPTSTSEEEETMSATTNNEDDDDNTAFTPFTPENSDKEVESSSTGNQEQEEVTAKKEDNRSLDDDGPVIYWDID